MTHSSRVFVCFVVQIAVTYSLNYTLYEITAFNSRERGILYSVYTKEYKIYFLNGISNEAAITINVAVDSRYDHAFQMKLNAFDIKDISEKHTCTDQSDITNTFCDWEYILKWVDDRINLNNNLQKIVIAKTYERRDIFILKISNGKKNPIVFIVAGEDGKDWISTAIILNFVNSLLKEKDKDKSLLNYYDFYLVPVLNPDGYKFSQSFDRFWSKNRREFFPPVFCLNNTNAVGVNIARNWFIEKTAKLVDEECKGIYVGCNSLSEEETQTLSYVLNGLALNMITFINLKGFGKFITIPYAHKEPSKNHDIVMGILTSACTTIKNMYNVTYHVDTTNRFIYNFSGNMADWVKKKLNIPLVFTLYMKHQNNFLPKPEDIILLTQPFYMILNETLVIVKDIYGPLYNKEIQIFEYNAIINLLIISYVIIIH